MCARRRSNLSLASPPVAGREKVTKEKATPLSVSPSLRYGATCGARFRRGPRKLAWRLKQRAALIRLKLCSSARPEGKGSRAALRAIAALGPGVGSARGAGSGAGFSGAQALGAQCNCRITMQRSETRAQTPMPEWWAQRGFFAIHAFGRALLWR